MARTTPQGMKFSARWSTCLSTMPACGRLVEVGAPLVERRRAGPGASRATPLGRRVCEHSTSRRIAFDPANEPAAAQVKSSTNTSR